MKQEISIALLKKDITYLKEGIDDIKGSLKTMVPNDSEYKELKGKVDNLWDDRNKVIGWLIGSGVIGGSVSVLAQNLVKVIQAKF